MKYLKISSLVPDRDWRSLKGCVCATHPLKVFKCCCFVVVGVLIIELMFFNMFIMYGYHLMKDNITPVLNKQSNSWIDKFAESKMVRDFVYSGKAGGFVSLIQQTLERVYVAFPEDGSNRMKVGMLGLDVSHSGESLFLYRRLSRRRKFMYEHLVVDIGANDGFLSSNSFNFIQWGWDAILVEPQTKQLRMAMLNLRRYNNPYRDGNQTVRFVEAIIGNSDAMVDFVNTDDMVSMEGHVLQERDLYDKKLRQSLIKVQSLSVKTFVTKYGIPRYFGILSIDAEGGGNTILHSFMELGYRPAFIIYEDLHERQWETPAETIEYLAGKGYRFLSKRGWNNILEHMTDSDV
ncbi:uncharacterized protein LOC110458555 [Mizuhopecten yessoensis]|uniref:uncharacterized protein LOC110458555 n=1 Tax=Mizuhopecten yessoensis TaxID=6573 RepID=UPI000B459D20|nr:uncharacterized protein LOC110458555 [Mizuhopecten yessoensis]XP_021365985.1 uncharacterized protein LOC110458555 [Mizuhopecten yessoensis]